MRKLLVLVGLQGAGKTTALHSVKNAQVLRSSTSRKRRAGESTDDYHFEAEWDPQLMAWELDFGTSKYGMRKAELETVIEVGITVFEPGNIGLLEAAKPALNFEVITIGLDTIPTLQDQSQRVNADPKRTVSTQQEFDRQRSAVQECDVVFSGDAGVVTDGIEAVISSVSGRGGLLDSDIIKKFIAARTLLTNAQPAHIEPASYDLTLADQYWCQGQYIKANGSEVIRIPAYSFVFVTAQEEACLPRFIGGSFDLTVSMFFDGIILSNGPQVDPGYRGALFCMLYNTTDVPVALNRGFKFATIQFCTTAKVTSGYRGQYQLKKTFQDFVQGRVAISPGGKILERLTAVENNLLGKHKELRAEVLDAAKTARTDSIAWFGVLVAVVLGISGYAYLMGDKASAAADKAIGGADRANAAADKALGGADKASSVAEKSESSIGGIKGRIDKIEIDMMTLERKTSAPR